MYSFVCLSILIVMYVPFWVLFLCVLCIVCVWMCTLLLPPGVNPIAVNKYIKIVVQGEPKRSTTFQTFIL